MDLVARLCHGHNLTLLNDLFNMPSDIFTPPIRITDCGHDYCEVCLTEVRQEQHEWQCPETRQVHRKEITELTRNYRLERFVDAYKKQQKEKAEACDDGLCEVHQRPIELCELKFFVEIE